MVAGGEADARALFNRLIPAAAGLAERHVSFTHASCILSASVSRRLSAALGTMLRL